MTYVKSILLIVVTVIIFTINPSLGDSSTPKTDPSHEVDDHDNTNPCRYDPCRNGGTCRYIDDAFICSCVPGYAGETCQKAITDLTDPCWSNPCAIGITCNNHGEYFTCQNDNNICQYNPCENGALCTAAQDGTFTCLCTSGYSGDTCTDKMAPASSIALIIVACVIGVIVLVVLGFVIPICIRRKRRAVPTKKQPVRPRHREPPPRHHDEPPSHREPPRYRDQPPRQNREPPPPYSKTDHSKINMPTPRQSQDIAPSAPPVEVADE